MTGRQLFGVHKLATLYVQITGAKPQLVLTVIQQARALQTCSQLVDAHVASAGGWIAMTLLQFAVRPIILRTASIEYRCSRLCSSKLTCSSRSPSYTVADMAQVSQRNLELSMLDADVQNVCRSTLSR